MNYENFISYRRKDTAIEVKNLYDALQKRGYSTFCDIYSMGSAKFDDELKGVIDSCTNFILVLGPHSLDRCTDESDWLYREIKEAIIRKKNITCVFTSKDFTFPDSLPKEIDEIRFRNGLVFDIFYFDAFLDKLVASFLVSKESHSESDEARDFIIIDKVLVKYVGHAQIVNIPLAVDSIGKYAFKDQTRVTKVVFHDGISLIDESAFERCIGLTYIHFPKSLRALSSLAFSRCYNLSYVEFNDDLQEIGEKCFNYCEKLKYLQLGKGLTKIHPSAFNNCSQLTEFHVDKNNAFYTSISGILYDKNVEKIIRCPENHCSDMISVPETVKTIGQWSFSRCMRIIEISLPRSIEKVEAYAFKDCCNILSLTLYDLISDFDITAIDGWQEGQNIIMGKHFHPIIKYNIEQKLKELQNNRPINAEAGFCLVKTAFESREEAKKIASMLLDKKLIVSGQIKEMESVYMWDGNVCKEREYELTCFTERTLYPEIEKFINEHHSYELCEIICLPIIDISKDFGDWIMNYVNC